MHGFLPTGQDSFFRKKRKFISRLPIIVAILNTKSQILYLQNRVAYASDEQAYKKLFYHFYKPLCRFAYSLVKNTEDVEEIVSDVLLKLWLMEAKLGIVEDLPTYLYRATKNSCLNYLQSANHKKELVTDGLSDNIPELFFETPSGERSEVQLLLEKAVNDLPPKCQMVFRLIKETGMSHKQVMEILDISQNTIETQMRIALRKIREQLNAYIHE
jgi:RNA polymerase sigma-70 factor (ECF subfamily)